MLLLRATDILVRFKLDQAGIKLSLRQWASFSVDDRFQLLGMSCDTPHEVMLHKNHLQDLLAVRVSEPAKEIKLDAFPVWACTDEIPESLIRHAASLQVSPPSFAQWTALLPLQRFAIPKLTKEGHDDVNFVPAMREIGLLDAADSTALAVIEAPVRI